MNSMLNDSQMDSASTSRKLDMKHGFVKSIIKNQIDRDEYHKLMEERKEEYKKEINGSPRQEVGISDMIKKAPIPLPSNLYIPPHKRGGEALNRRLSKKRNVVPSFLTDTEESRIREKVRAQVKALGDVDISAVKNASPSQKGATKALFKLNLASDGGNVEITVLSSDNPARLSKTLSRQYGLTESECRLLRETLEIEIESRLNLSVS